jgi:hypothetical protein
MYVSMAKFNEEVLFEAVGHAWQRLSTTAVGTYVGKPWIFSRIRFLVPVESIYRPCRIKECLTFLCDETSCLLSSPK